MSEPEYDDFGNLIGSSSSARSHSRSPSPARSPAQSQSDQSLHSPTRSHRSPSPLQQQETQQVILHEDKSYYPSAIATYGPTVDVQVQEQDTQPLTQPIIAIQKTKRYHTKKIEKGDSLYDTAYMIEKMKNAKGNTRNVAVVGMLHHGKTTFLDYLVKQTHDITVKHDNWERDDYRYTDTHPISRVRHLSIKTTPITLMLQSRKQQHPINFFDTPGHPDFFDETLTALTIADGAIVVVDIVEGVLCQTERVIQALVRQNIPFIVVLNKMDRMITQLRLAPVDAYFKLRHVLGEINTVIKEADPEGKQPLMSPLRNNVVFGSGDSQYVFTLDSFAEFYSQQNGFLDAFELSKRLWGDLCFDSETRKFVRPGPGIELPRTFVHFILEPMYKIYSQVLDGDEDLLKATMKELGIKVRAETYALATRPLLRIILATFFGTPSPLIDSIAQHIPSPESFDVARKYTGPLQGPIPDAIRTCDSEGPLMMHIIKNYPSEDESGFLSFGRIYSGKIKVGQTVRVLGEGYSADDEEDCTICDVESLVVSAGRYYIPVTEAVAGMCVLIGGLRTEKCSTVTGMDEENVYIFRNVEIPQPVFKVAIEPQNPTELPKMLEGLRKISATYVGAHTRVEESGEHVLLGSGELYMDCILHDLRILFSEIEIKVSDPITRFTETVLETSALQCSAMAPNEKNSLTFIAQPLEKGIAEAIETKAISLSQPVKEVSQFFQGNFGWDILAARSIWAFGPTDHSPNILLNDTLPTEVDKKALNSIRDGLTQGFQWACREGPLCDEPMRNVKFNILHATIANEPIFRGGGQIIPTARRVCYSSFLTATPRLMEPINAVEVLAPADCVDAVYTVLSRRRGHVTQDLPKAGTPLSVVKALIPVMDSIGFETDLRTHTQGQAFCLQSFSHWSIVPGDPLDKTAPLKPLEPAMGISLARDFMIKTRRRKGLSAEVSVVKYFDPMDEASLAALAQTITL